MLKRFENRPTAHPVFDYYLDICNCILMHYLGTEYALAPVTTQKYITAATRFAALVEEYDVTKAISIATKRDDAGMVETITAQALHFNQVYDHGSGFYILGIGASLTALRPDRANKEKYRISSGVWEKLREREQELQARPEIHTLEQIGGIGLLEITAVNAGYVDGYQDAFDKPGLTPFLGFTGLGALHAHDLVHFASTQAESNT